MKRQIAAFDFDGTLTRKDTLLLFIKHVKGYWGIAYAIFRCLPWIAAYKIGVYPNWKAKQRLFSTCFNGMGYSRFIEYGISFAVSNPDLLRKDAVRSLEKHLVDGDTVYVVTASMEEWVKPLLASYPSIKYIATIPECVEGRLTGRFASPNCYGREKVRRFVQYEPFRDEYVLFAYGDSAGDKALLSMADKSYYRMFP